MTELSLSKLKDSKKCEKICKTAVIYLSFFALGLAVAIPGPTLLDLQQAVQTETSKITFIYLARSCGYVVGSILSGVIFDIVKHKQLALFFCNLVMSVSLLVTPWMRSIETLVSILAVCGISAGAMDIGSNVLCLNIWGKDSAPFYQALHFLFGVGAFIAPLIAEPFLSKPCSLNLNSTTPLLQSNITSTLSPYLPSNITFDATASTITCPTEEIPPVTYSYSIIGSFSLFITLLFIVLAVVWPLEQSEEKQKGEDESNSKKQVQRNLGYTLLVAVLTMLLLGIYCGVEIGYGQMIMTYAVKGELKLSKSTGSYLTAVFFGVFTFSRGISIFLSLHLTPFTLVFGDLILMLLGCSILCFLGNTSESYLWAGTVILAIGLASFYPSVISWIERYIVISNKILSLCVIAAAAGEMIIPLTVSQYIDTEPHMLMYIILGCTIGGIVMTFFVWLVTNRKGDRYNDSSKENKIKPCGEQQDSAL